MIVVCNTCQARFKVADDKIGPRGAKVRCSKCQTVFVVHRELGVMPAEPAAPPPAAIPPAAAPAPARPRGMELDLESEPMGGTRPSGLIADPFARAAPGAGVDPFAAHAAPPAAADPFAAAPAPAAHDPFAADPFGAPGAHAPAASGGGSPFGAVDPFVATVASAQPGAPSLAVTDLSDLIGSSAPSGTPIPAAPPVELPSEPSGILESGFDFDASAGPSPELVAPTPVPFQPPQPAAPEPDLALAERTPSTAAPVPGEVPMPGASDFGGIDPFSGGASQDFGGPDEDFAAEPEPSRPPPAPAPAAAPPLAPLEIATQAPAAPPVVPESPPAEGPEAEAAAGLRRRGSRFHAIAINAISLAALIVVAVGFLAVWRGVRPGGAGGLRGLFSRSVGVAEGFSADRLRSGLYDRADAPPLLFVTGNAISHAVAAVPGLRVRVEILSKGAVVARGEARAGAVPTPEQIYATKDAAGLSAVLDQAGAGAPASVKPGDSVPFLVAITEFPPDVTGLGLRVDVEPVAPAAPGAQGP